MRIRLTALLTVAGLAALLIPAAANAATPVLTFLWRWVRPPPPRRPPARGTRPRTPSPVTFDSTTVDTATTGGQREVLGRILGAGLGHAKVPHGLGVRCRRCGSIGHLHRADQLVRLPVRP